MYTTKTYGSELIRVRAMPSNDFERIILTFASCPMDFTITLAPEDAEAFAAQIKDAIAEIITVQESTEPANG